MNERVTVTLDFTGCKYIGEVFHEMRIKMEWDDDFGENLSALWDILRGMPYKGEDFTIIRPRWFTGIPHGQSAGFTEYVDKICSIFRRAETRGFLTVKIEYTDGGLEDLSGYKI